MLQFVSMLGSLAVVIASILLIVTMLKGSAAAIVSALLGVERTGRVARTASMRRRRPLRVLSLRQSELRAAA